MTKIMKDIITYGTSEKMFSKKRNLSMIRDFMLPELKIKRTIMDINFRSKGDFLIFDPIGKFKQIWTIVSLLLLVYTAILMPYKLALIDDDNSFFFYLDTVVDFLFLTDIFVNLNSPIEESNGVYNYNRKKVFVDYLKGWLFLDIIASIPMNLLSKYILDEHVSGLNSSQAIIKFARIPRLYRLLRITRLFKILKVLNKTIF